MRKNKDDRPLPPMLVGDKKPPAAARLDELADKHSLVLPEAPPVAAEEQEAPVPDRAKTGTAAADGDDSLPGCLTWVAVTVSILAFLKETDLPGELGPILALVVLLGAPGLYWWSITKEERHRARQSRVSAPDYTPVQVAAPPSEDPPAVT